MNIKQLRFVLAVAKTESFSKAANLCHVTQPTLSNAIAQLEVEFENRIFDRTTRSVALTPFGRYVLTFIERSVSELDEIVSSVNAWRNPTHNLIRLGLSPVVDMRLLQAVLAPFRDAHPNVEFFYKECYLNDLDQRLKARELDVIIMPPREPRAGDHKVDLYQEPLCYVPCNGGQFDAMEKHVSLPEAASENLVLTIDACGLRSVTLDLFENGNVAIKEYPGQATTYSVVEDWAELGIGAGILPQSKISANNGSALPLLLDSGEPAHIACEAVWTSATAASVHAQAFLEHLETEAPGIVAKRTRQYEKTL